jgi:hypothetical protein
MSARQKVPPIADGARLEYDVCCPCGVGRLWIHRDMLREYPDLLDVVFCRGCHRHASSWLVVGARDAAAEAN